MKGIKKSMNNKYINEEDRKYCYPNSDVLINKLNITDYDELYNAEREIVAYQTLDLLLNPVKGNFDFDHLKEIHKRLFGNIYEWAGTPRTCIVIKETSFCMPEHIESYAEEIFSKLKNERFYLKYDYNNKMLHIANLFANINALHPFREGNGRTQREFIEELSKINGINLDLSKVSKNNMSNASIESYNGKNEKLLNMFSECSTKLSYYEKIEYCNLYFLDEENKPIKLL